MIIIEIGVKAWDNGEYVSKSSIVCQNNNETSFLVNAVASSEYVIYFAIRDMQGRIIPKNEIAWSFRQRCYNEVDIINAVKSHTSGAR